MKNHKKLNKINLGVNSREVKLLGCMCSCVSCAGGEQKGNDFAVHYAPVDTGTASYITSGSTR